MTPTVGGPGEDAQERAGRLAAFLRVAFGARSVHVPPIDAQDVRRGRLRVEVGFPEEARDALAVVVELAPGSQAERLAIVEAARAAGVPAPEPLFACEDAAVLGRPFHVLRASPGASSPFPAQAPGSPDLGSPDLGSPDPGSQNLQARVLESLGATLARLHAVRPPWPGLESLEDPGPSVALVRIAEMRRRLDVLGAPQPALEWVLRTLERRASRFDEVVLGHGGLDRSACRVVGETLVAIERWGGARWAHPLEDVARLCLGLEREGPVEAPLGALLAAYREAADRALDVHALPYWLLVAATEDAVESLEGLPDQATPRAVLEAFSRAEAMRASGAADLARIGGARRAVESEILSRAGGGGGRARSQGERHLSALYGDDTVQDGFSRFARDVRDGVFDGACAQGARVLIKGWLEETLAAGPGAGQGEGAPREDRA